MVLFWGIFSISAAFLTHVLIWRVSPPKNSGVALIAIFLGVFLVLAALCLLAGWSAPGVSPYLPSGMEHARVTVFYLALMCGYIMTYPAIEVESPSLTIVNMIAKAGPGGLPAERLYAQLDDDAMLWPRADDLVNERALVFHDNRYQLTPKGRFITGVFAIFNRLLGAPEKGG